MTLTADKARELLSYNAETGVLRWRKPIGSAKAGAVAGCIKRSGYCYIKIAGKGYFAHRLAWLITFGEWPKEQLDHRNGDCHDNRLANLREATCAENQQNLPPRGSSTSGHLGVTWCKGSHKWQARITLHGHLEHLGYFDDPERAALAYREAKLRLHKFQPTMRASMTEAAG